MYDAAPSVGRMMGQVAGRGGLLLVLARKYRPRFYQGSFVAAPTGSRLPGVQRGRDEEKGGHEFGDDQLLILEVEMLSCCS